MIKLSKEQIKELEKEDGLPLYIFNSDEFIDNYIEIKETFSAVYPKYEIAYSYKTNYTPAICKTVKELGGYAEVVSDMEYQLALDLGYPAEKIIFNGPAKGKFFEKHILKNGLMNIDNWEEVLRVCNLAQNHPEQNLSVGVRVNFDISAGYISRFGIDIDELQEVFDILEMNDVRVEGLHCHLSRARDLEAWRKRAEEIIKLIQKYNMSDLRYVSLGSGMYGHMDEALASQFCGHVPNYKEYAETVFGVFAAFYDTNKDYQKPIIFTEPGTTLVSKYVDFVGKVTALKSIRGKQFAFLNCSFHNLGETAQMKNLPIELFSNHNSSETLENADFVGYTCLEQDVLYRNYSGKLGVGDYVEFGNVGGYSLVDKPPFIMPNCPMIALGTSVSNGKKLVKKQEMYDDIFHTFIY